jgi:hypothetical protein
MSMSVVVGQEYSPRVVFAVIPVVVVPVVAVIDPDLDPGIIRCWGGHHCHRCRKGGSQEKRTNVKMCRTHKMILQEYSAISALERREVKVNFLILPSVMVPVFPNYPFVNAS